METLRDFWTWFDTTKPQRVPSAQLGRLSEHARSALCYAAERVLLRDTRCTSTESAIQRYPEIVRELSFAICAGLERMQERIPAIREHALCEHGSLRVDEATGACSCERCGKVLTFKPSKRPAKRSGEAAE